jgi:AbrB family looped-hinge helix DNA binding protein
VYEAKLSTKNQIVIPREARSALDVKTRDRLLVIIRNGTVILLPKPKKYSKSLKGMRLVSARTPPGRSTGSSQWLDLSSSQAAQPKVRIKKKMGWTVSSSCPNI